MRTLDTRFTRLAAALLAAIVLAWPSAGAAQVEGRKLTDSSIPTASALQDSDLFLLVQNSISKKLPYSVLAGSFDEYLLLAGRSGGQSAYGGTDTGDALVLQANSFDSNPGGITLDEAATMAAAGVTMTISSSGFSVTGAPYYQFKNGLFDSPLMYIDNSADRVRVWESIDITTDTTDPDSGACISYDSGADRLYHDVDCDKTKDAGDQYIDQGDTKETLQIAAADMALSSGLATLSVIGGMTPMWALADSATNEVCGYAAIPKGKAGATFKIYIYSAPSSTSTCNYWISLERKVMADATNIGTGGTLSSFAMASSGSSNVADYYDPSISVSTSSTDVGISACLSRIGGHGSDTCANDLRFLALQLEEQ